MNGTDQQPKPPSEAWVRYLAAAHAMQTGVAFKLDLDAKEAEPKHLRVGINSTMVSQDALVNLLISKGLITLDEFEEYLAAAMEREAQRYAQWLQQHMQHSKIQLI